VLLVSAEVSDVNESKGEIVSWVASINNKMAMRNLFVRELMDDGRNSDTQTVIQSQKSFIGGMSF
jgi:hypothetical protein